MSSRALHSPISPGVVSDSGETADSCVEEAVALALELCDERIGAHQEARSRPA